uniref:sesquipedalian-1-like n=1 Tax=Styela clava TaxID=7725 RepID=UPI001939BC67|nr:sesquipedalian-1-like [Styela clava]
MKINEKALSSFANCNICSDKEGWLWKKGELNTSYQKRWCVLRGNLLFYFDKRYDKDPIGVIVLENCTVQLAEGGDSSYTFSIIFLGNGMRTYKLVADDEESCNDWIKSLSLCSFRYLKILVEELEEKSNQTKYQPTLLIPDSQQIPLVRGLRNAASTEDISKGRVKTTKKITKSSSEKSLQNLIDTDEKPLKIVNTSLDGAKTKTIFYPLLSQPHTLLKVEYGGKGKTKKQTFLASNKSKIPTLTSANRSFIAMHEYFRQGIEELAVSLS